MEYLKDEVLKEIPRGGFGIFVDAWYMCDFCNMDQTSKSYFIEIGNKVRGVSYNTSGEAQVANTYNQCYPVFLVGHSSHDIAVGTLLPRLSTLDEWSRAGNFGT